MKIWEIEPKSNIILKVSIKGQHIDLPTVSYSQESDGIVCEAVRVQGKAVSLDGIGVSIEVMFIRTEKSPVLWRGIVCETIYIDSKMFYKITCREDGVEKNRREAFRVFIGVSGVAQLGLNKKAVNVIVKDVSENGFSFISDEDFEDVVNVPVRLVYTDMEINFSLMGIVVRKVKIDEKKNLYGCKLSVENSRLGQYIIQKQRQALSAKGGNASRELGRKNSKDDDLVKDNQSRGIQKNRKYDEENEKKYRIVQSYEDMHKRSLDSVDKSERRRTFR
ncbi:MAG: PilZ domain-containing protein [Lachnospira sp.]|nr:PilZ domain-containing protein [Lachnospira sp.]